MASKYLSLGVRLVKFTRCNGIKKGNGCIIICNNVENVVYTSIWKNLVLAIIHEYAYEILSIRP